MALRNFVFVVNFFEFQGTKLHFEQSFNFLNKKWFAPSKRKVYLKRENWRNFQHEIDLHLNFIERHRKLRLRIIAKILPKFSVNAKLLE